MAKKGVYGIAKDGRELRTQHEFLLDFLMRKPGKKVSSWDVWERWGFTRLSAIVKKIEDRLGVHLERADEYVVTRFGVKVRVRRYWYAENS